MPQAARAGDAAVSGDGAVRATDGSPDVFINGVAALRADDAPIAESSGASWQGSRGVIINGMPALRTGDAAGAGQVADGSPDVMFGDVGPGTPKEKPHDRAITIEFTDALGRPIDEISIEVFCPHQPSQTKTVDGKTTIGGVCGGTTITGHAGLVGGKSDPGAGHTTPTQSHHHVGSTDGGAGLPSKKTVIHAPAPTEPSPTIHLHRPDGGTTVVVSTLHNWVELVYQAFGFDLPIGQRELAILGVREASLSGAAKRDNLEIEAGRGDVTAVDFTREQKAQTYNDLLFCAYTDKSIRKKQIVDVYECTIDASPGKGPLHLPFLTEGRLFHATPGPWRPNKNPGKDIALHVFTGKKEPEPSGKGTAAEVIAEAQTKLGYLEGPNNATYFGDWYGSPNTSWCAMFVSWVMWKAGLSYIRYIYCPTGWGEFMSGTWGTWHSSHDSEGNQTATAEPGDIVFYQWDSNEQDSHTGIVLHDDGRTITTIEGNTGTSEISDPAGGGVHMRTRTKDFTVKGFGRPHYKMPDDAPTSIIRWGSEGGKVDLTSARGNTLLHHHYFDGKAGHEKVDPAAKRYQEFVHVYREAKNKSAIPYLIVSSQYVLSYSEWLASVDANPGEVAKPSSVIRRQGLAAPTGFTRRFAPSYFSVNYADRVLAHAKEMHDKKAAEKLVHELEDALIKPAV